MQSTRPMTLITLGAPGVGKSNVLNKLVGQIKFKSSASAASGVTKKISHHIAPAFGKQGNLMIKVFDPPGVTNLFIISYLGWRFGAFSKSNCRWHQKQHRTSREIWRCNNYYQDHRLQSFDQWGYCLQSNQRILGKFNSSAYLLLDYPLRSLSSRPRSH